MPADQVLPSPAEVRAAAARIAGDVVRTPLARSPKFTTALGGEVFLKLECLQRGGSFKLRGALNALHCLAPEVRSLGVVASSAGNHGIGIALAAASLKVPATIFVPRTAPEVKRAKIRAAGATIDDSQPSYDAAERAAREFAAKRAMTFISPCSGRTLLAGAGTVALELLEDLPTVGTVIIPVGGGGLCGGMAGYIRGTANGVRILGCQSIRTNAMALALASGRPTDIPDLPTLADGLAGLVDAEMLAQGQAALDAIATVEEDAIAEAMRWLHDEHQLTVEGSGAVGVAALRAGALKPTAFPVAVVVSGANVDGRERA